MAYKEYFYGSYKKEIKDLMRKRLSTLDKIRRHENRANDLKQRIVSLEKDIDRFLDLANGKNVVGEKKNETVECL